MNEHVIAHRPAAISAAAIRRAWAALLAVALCLGLVPSAAWASEGASDAPAASEGVQGTASLAIACDADGDGVSEVVLNKAYGFYAAATLGDLFEAAKEAGDIEDYRFADSGYGAYLGSVTLADGTEMENAADFSRYWSTYKNGSYASGSEGQEGEALVGGVGYQFEWAGYPATAQPVDWAALPDPEASSTVAGEAGSAPEPGPDPDEPLAGNAYDAAKADALLGNLAARYAKGGADAAMDNGTMAAAIALNALGEGGSIDAAALAAGIAGYEAQYGAPMAAGTLAKYVMALTAAGVDCRAAEVGGATIDLVAEMASRAASSEIDAYAAVWILPVCDRYGVDGADLAGKDLTGAILAGQDGEGLIGSPVYGGDSQTTAQAILALLPHRDADARVPAALSAAEKALLARQNADGGFAYTAVGEPSNLDASANVAAALVALGYDVAQGDALTTENGSTPVGYLLSLADDDLSGYRGASSYNEAMTSSTVLLGLAASKGFQQNGGAFDVYDLRSVEAPGGADGKAPAGSDQANGAGAPLAQTGDAPAAPAFAALALCALAGAALALRRSLPEKLDRSAR